MRVFVYLNSFDTGGVERTALRMVRVWRAMGLDVILWVARDAGAMRDEFADEAPGIGGEDSQSGKTRGLFDLISAVRSTRPDILFCAGNTYSFAAVMLRLRLGRDCPPIVAKISNDLYRMDMNPVVRWGYRRWLRIQGRYITRFVAMAETLRAEVETLMQVARARVSVIEDPALAVMPEPREIEHPKARAGRRFVTIGRLAEQKNQKLMLRAFARGAAPADRLTLYGDGPLADPLAELAGRLGIEGRVEFAGYRADAAECLANHDIFLLSSDYEGLPAVLVEALANAMPIVTTRSSAAIDDLLEHGQLGHVVEPGDVEAFASAIQQARPDAQQAERARARAAHFTVARAAKRYAELFTQITGDSRPTSKAA